MWPTKGNRKQAEIRARPSVSNDKQTSLSNGQDGSLQATCKQPRAGFYSPLKVDEGQALQVRKLGPGLAWS
jgi:hypothetical protein